MEENNLVSSCCGAEDQLYGEDGPSYSDTGICPKCHEHTSFITQEEWENEQLP